MRLTSLRFALIAAAAGLSVAPATAQFGPRAEIAAWQLGFRPGGGGEKDGGNPVGVTKGGLWAPVTVAIEFQDVRGYKGGVTLEVTTLDCDELRTVTRTPILDPSAYEPGTDEFFIDRGKGVMKEKTENTHTAYVRMFGDADVKLRLVETDNPDRALSDTKTVSPHARPASRYVILSLGATPEVGFTPPSRGDDPTAPPYLRNGRVELAHIDTVQEMPDQWFGYEAADLVVLGTGKPSKEFIANLFNSDSEQFARKRRALVEWVRRGGKLVLAAGDRAAEVGASADFAAVLPVAVSPAGREASVAVSGFGERRDRFDPQGGFRLAFPEKKFDEKAKTAAMGVFGGLPAARTVADPKSGLPDKLPPDLFPLAALKPNARKTTFATLATYSKGGEAGDMTSAAPLVVQAPLGLGRVTVVGFDLDRSPFTDPANRAHRTAFWDALVTAAGDELSAKPPVEEAPQQKPNQWGGSTKSSSVNSGREAEDGASAALRANVDHYDEVPVISFGWVALFILGYTLLIGPIEYVLLKKLFGRLELTWITFPIIVLTVSGAAYLTAYVVKGKDLRMNKIDVVDVDLRTDPARPRVYGRTWFTIFSPRIDSYTIGVEPKDNWATQRDEKGYTPVTTVDGFGPPKQTGLSGGGSRGYRYEIDPGGDTSPQANGVTGVPIQVWSTKAFVANWSGVADPDKPPAVSTLVRGPSGRDVVIRDGAITFNLSLKEVEQAYAVYQGQVYEVEKSISPDVPLRFRPGGDLKGHKPLAESPFKNDQRFMYQEQEQEDDYGGGFGGRKPRNQPKVAGGAADQQKPLDLFGLLFHQHASKVSGLQNSTLRPLDQSWRMTEKNENEVILVFKMKRQRGGAEEMMTAPDSSSPTRVWLHGLPGHGQPREPLDKDAILQQDTYIRMYLPVKPPGGK